MSIIFKHSGKIGDLLYSLYYVKEMIEKYSLSDAELYLKLGEPEPDHTQRLSESTASWIKPLLEATGLFSEISYGTTPPKDCLDLDLFRDRRVNLARGDIKLWYHELDPVLYPKELWKPILEVRPNQRSRGRIVVTRTPRYNNSKIDYKYLYKYKDRLSFIGVESEYRAFCRDVFPISYEPCTDALACARYMAGSSGVIVNASGLCALAEILKVPRVFVDAHPPVVHPIGGEFMIANDPTKFAYGVTWLATRDIPKTPVVKRDIAIFCTHSQHKQDLYTHRVVHWYKTLAFLHDKADFYTFVDGKLNEANKATLTNAGVTVVELTPWIGRSSFDDFRGFKRSFGTALKLLASRYDYISHIENDSVVINEAKLVEYINKPGLWSGWLGRDRYMESAFSLINDHDTAADLGEKYSRKEYYADGKCFELCLQKYPFQYPFKVDRIEGNTPDIKLDVWTQYTGYFPAPETFR